MLDIKLKNLPQTFGVYIFKNEFSDIIYIGKAKNLKKRVLSYFQNKNHSVKTKTLVKRIRDIEYFSLNSEVEALLLENKLIKKHNPKYNIELKDDKTYAYLKITDEKFPKLMMCRRVNRNKKKFLGEFYFGPYTNGFVRYQIYNLAVELFQILTRKTFQNKTTLYFDIGLAPSKNLKDLNREKYLENVKMTIDFLKGKNIKQIIQKLNDKIIFFNEKMEFEKSQKVLEKIRALENLENQNNQVVDLIKNNSQDIIVFKKVEDYFKFLVLKIQKGVIIKKEVYDIYV